MIKTKYLITLILILSVCQIMVGKKRIKPIDIEALTSPSSPSYVPYPYPKTRKEIISDFEYAADKLFVRSDRGEYVGGKVPKVKVLVKQILDKNSIYRIGEILKVKNRNYQYEDEYSWLILVMDKNGGIASRVVMLANGLFGAVADTRHTAGLVKCKSRSGKRPKYFYEEEDVRNRLQESLGEKAAVSRIKKMERVAFSSVLGCKYIPMWEIVSSDETVYYFSVKRDTVFVVEKKSSQDQQMNMSFEEAMKRQPISQPHIRDSINEEILWLKEIPRK